MTYLPAPVGYARTKKEAEEKARKYIKPGHRLIRKVHGVGTFGAYRGKEYNYVIYVK